MQLQVTFRGTKPRDEVRRRAELLFGKLERFLDAASEGTLVVSREHGSFEVEITVHAHGQTFQAKDEDEDLRTALDRMFHTIENTLRRAKEKREDRWRGRGPKPDGFVAAGPEDDDEAADRL